MKIRLSTRNAALVRRLANLAAAATRDMRNETFGIGRSTWGAQRIGFIMSAKVVALELNGLKGGAR